MEEMVSAVENKLYRSVFYSEGTVFISKEELAEELQKIKNCGRKSADEFFSTLKNKLGIILK